MKQLYQILYRLFHPPIGIVAVSIPITVFLMLYVFAGNHKDNWIAYTSYFISAYSLMIVCIWVIKLMKQKLSMAVHRNSYINRYVSDAVFRTHISLYQTLIVNLCFCVCSLYFGINYHSIWYDTLTVYYGLLAVMRFILLYHMKKNDTKDIRQGYHLKYCCGIILLIMNTVLAGVVVLTIHQEREYQDIGVMIYAAAMYAFYAVTIALINVIKYRHVGSPVLSAAKAINLITALVTIFSLETAMLAQFSAADDVKFSDGIMRLTGAAVCMLVFGTAMYMIIQSAAMLNRNETV